MSQISKKTTVSKPTEESQPSHRGAQKPKTVNTQPNMQPKLNFNPQGFTPTTVGDQSVNYHGPSSMKDSLLKTHDPYLEGLKPPIAKKDLLNKTQKENEQKSFYRSLKIDLSGYVDKENLHGTEEDLELFNFQEIEQQIQLENRVVTHHVTEGEHPGGNRTPRRELALKNSKLTVETEKTEKKQEPLSTITTNGNFLPHPKNQASFKGRSHNAKVVSNIKAVDAKKSLSPIGSGGSNPKKTLIDLQPNTAPQKNMTRSNSVLMRRDKSKENSNNATTTATVTVTATATAAATSGATSSGLTPRGARNANLKGRAANNASMWAGDKSPRSQTSSIPLHSLSVYGASSPLSGPHTNSVMVVPQENSSGTNQREGKRAFPRSQRSFSKDYNVSPSLVKNDMSMFKEPLLEKTETSNIKVIARFRPMNNLENELVSSGMESECAIFPSEKSIVTVPGSEVWTYDAVFQPSSSQEQIYNFLARETIDDVLQGYNGTIFAYGQTSSGKTHSMYGEMYDEEKKGVIPRASHIFNFIRNMDDDVEFVIKCSMLEIYKETLYDLLNDRASNLKIKESPLRGIYIDHLTEISVCSEEEMLGVLEMGHQCRSIATTQLNQYSSRSHTLFIVEITQKFPNQSEKVGKLNLVDLAGSEKVGKSGATGETLEEAKKINLSLSCLGNVIHALTSNAEHIPYRDSKLTRILQESLGGNYKTSLIVTCSPCSSNKEETISTLKFAARAKTIKTHYKVNVHMSSESMARMIEKLRAELEAAIAEIARLRNGEGPSRTIGSHKEEDFDYNKCSEHISTDLGAKSISYQTEGKDNYRMNSLTTPNSSIGIGMNAGFRAILENNLQLNSGVASANGPRETFIQFYSNEVSLGSKDRRSGKQSGTEGSFKLGSELLNQNEVLESRVQALQKSLDAANQSNREKDMLLELKDAEIKGLKDNLAHFEEKLNKLNEESQLQHIKIGHQNDIIENTNVKIQVLETQAHALTEALISCEQSVEGQLKEKFKIVNQKFTDFTKEILAFKDVNFSEYLDTKIDFNHQLFDTTGWTKESGSLIKSSEAPKIIKESFFGSRLDPKTIQTSRDSLKASMDVTGDIDVLLNKYGYLPTAHKSIMKDNISPELMTYLLRQQLIQCHIVNQNLERAIISFEWKQVIDSGKAKMSAKYMKMQENLIKSLEHVYEKAIVTHEKLREKARLIGNDSVLVQEDSVALFSGSSKGPYMSSPKAKILRSVTRESLNRRKTMKKYMESHATSKAQQKDNFAVSFTGSKKTGISMARLEDISALIVEIERDILATQNHPNTLDEAKIMLHFQNTIIEKIKNLILKTVGKTTSYTISQRDGHENKESLEYLQGEYGRLQNKAVVLHDQVKLEKARATQYKEVYLEAKRQIEQFKELIEQIEIAGKNALKLENEMWQSVIEELIANSRKEMQRKQDEVTQLSEQLAGWISKYMDLQQRKDAGSFQEASFVSDGGRRQERSNLNRDNKGVFDLQNLISHGRSETEGSHHPKNTSFTPPLINKKA